jgi:hypothetical protein
MPGLVPGIHLFANPKSWMPGMNPGMTISGTFQLTAVDRQLASL